MVDARQNLNLNDSCDLTIAIYCNAMPASLLFEQRKMIFYNKTLQSNNIVLRILCALHRNEARKLSSVCHIFSGHLSNNY